MDGSPPSPGGNTVGSRLDALRARIAGMRTRMERLTDGFTVPARPIPIEPRPSAQRLPPPPQPEAPESATDPALEAELTHAREQAQLMAHWAQDNEAKLKHVQGQLQRVLLETDQYRTEAQDLRRLADERQARLRAAADTVKKAEHEAALHRKKNADMARHLQALDEEIVRLRATTSEQTLELRTAKKKEAHLMKRVKDLKRGQKR